MTHPSTSLIYSITSTTESLACHEPESSKCHGHNKSRLSKHKIPRPNLRVNETLNYHELNNWSRCYKHNKLSKYESRSKSEFQTETETGLYQSHRMCDQFVTFVTVTNLQAVTDLTLWPNSFLCFFCSFFSKTSLVTFWSQMSQMVTLSVVAGTNLFLFLFRLKWFRMNEIRQNIPESRLLFGFRLGTALTNKLCTKIGSDEQTRNKNRMSRMVVTNSKFQLNVKESRRLGNCGHESGKDATLESVLKGDTLICKLHII